MDTAVLHEALDRLAENDLSLGTDTEIHERLLGMMRGRVRLEGLLYETLDVWDARTIWSGDGSTSGAARLAAETGIAKREASSAVSRARKLRSMPVTAAAIRDGELQPSCIEALFDARQVNPDGFDHYEATLVDACRAIGADESRRVLRNWIREHDADGEEERAKKRHAGRKLSAAETFDGMVHLNGLLPAVGGQEFLAELRRLERQLYTDDQQTGNIRTSDQRRADALVVMAQRSATLDIDEFHSGRSPRVSLTLVLGLNAAEHLCETLAGTPMPVAGIVPFLARCDIERIWFDGPDRPITTSPSRTFTGALRKAIQVRDRRCAHPAVCDLPADICDIDHCVEHQHGGPTSLDNGRVCCRRHNRNPELRHQAPTGPRTKRPPRGWIPDTHHRTRRTDDQDDDDDR
jgi:hypothetical protein